MHYHFLSINPNKGLSNVSNSFQIMQDRSQVFCWQAEAVWNAVLVKQPNGICSCLFLLILIGYFALFNNSFWKNRSFWVHNVLKRSTKKSTFPKRSLLFGWLVFYLFFFFSFFFYILKKTTKSSSSFILHSSIFVNYYNLFILWLFLFYE